MSPLSPMDIVRRTPKTNCGECGHASCLAYAAAVVKTGADPTLCPYINLDGMSLPDQTSCDPENLARARDLALVQHPKNKIAPLSFSEIAVPLGLEVIDQRALRFSYLGQETILTKEGMTIAGRQPEDPRDQILIYNYIYSRGGRLPDGTWIGMESLPNSISKIKTLAVYCEERLAEHFDRADQKIVVGTCREIGGEAVTDETANYAMEIPVLPRVPQKILYWASEPEDGFGARVKVLFDQNVLDFLDLESLVFSSERLADRLIALLA